MTGNLDFPFVHMNFHENQVDANLNLFVPYLQRWSAQAAGKPFVTPSSDLLPVSLTGKLEGVPAMIKISRDLDERIGWQVMQWWGSVGAARVYAHAPDSGTLLIERATGSKHLLRMALEGEDLERLAFAQMGCGPFRFVSSLVSGRRIALRGQ